MTVTCRSLQAMASFCHKPSGKPLLGSIQLYKSHLWNVLTASMPSMPEFFNQSPERYEYGALPLIEAEHLILSRTGLATIQYVPSMSFLSCKTPQKNYPRGWCLACRACKRDCATCVYICVVDILL